VLGQAIQQARRPPPVWLQASTATIYAHTHGPAWDEQGELGTHVPDRPPCWTYSVNIARSWRAGQSLRTPSRPG